MSMNSSGVLSTFNQAIAQAAHRLFEYGDDVHTEKWQRVDITNSPQHAMCEIIDHSLRVVISPDLDILRKQIKPNVPWADDHFLERVGGVPLNPGEQYKNWPYYRDNAKNDVHRKNGQFSHTYMERIWPKLANVNPPAPCFDEGCPHYPTDHSCGGELHHGVRYPYGDFNDVVSLLHKEPLTRQAYLPIWFPEDTGVVHGERVPCSLGYHFIMRQNELHCVYYIRSCDYFRHFRDDIYLACHKVLWLLDQLFQRDINTWSKVIPGTLTMHITSLHCFSQERPMLRRDF